MMLNFNVKGPERKRLVQLMTEVLDAEAKYLGAPSMAYKVGDFTISKDGEVSWPDLNDADPEKLEETNRMIEELEKAGFTPLEFLEEVPGTVDEVTIKVPKEYVNIENLKGILEAKGELIKKSLDVTSLEIREDEDCISFPWLTGERAAEEINAAGQLITALCKMSKELKRVNKTEKSIENEKYAFRCFLMRLGFVGAEYKGLRKILLSRLSGNAAYRDGRKAGDEDYL